jgi:hypothetical protein
MPLVRQASRVPVRLCRTPAARRRLTLAATAPRQTARLFRHLPPQALWEPFRRCRMPAARKRQTRRLTATRSRNKFKHRASQNPRPRKTLAGGFQSRRFTPFTPITARNGPYSVGLRTSRRTSPVVFMRLVSELRLWDEPRIVSARTRPLTRTQVSEFCSRSKPGGHGEADNAAELDESHRAPMRKRHRFMAVF